MTFELGKAHHSRYETKSFGKCILAGEHAVLRGVPALVVPVKSRELDLLFIPGAESLKVVAADAASDATKTVIWGVLEKGLSQVGKSFDDLRGTIEVKNSIPFGAGLGASAALCVVVGRFFAHLGWISPSDVFEFSRNLENLFHGESSGVDVAVAERAQAIRYVRGEKIRDLEIVWRPKLYLSFSGYKGVTKECVALVKDLWARDSKRGLELDQKMGVAVQEIEGALTGPSLQSDEREMKLLRGIRQAQECFRGWGLTAGNLDAHMDQVIRRGAMACKPTGSGLGGHVLSLWETAPPPTDIPFIPLEL